VGADGDQAENVGPRGRKIVNGRLRVFGQFEGEAGYERRKMQDWGVGLVSLINDNLQTAGFKWAARLSQVDSGEGGFVRGKTGIL